VGRTRRDGFTGEDLNAEPPVIEVLDVDGAAGKSRDELDLALVQEVVFPADEAGMLLLLDLENHVTGLDVRGLVTLASELDLGAAPDTSIHMDVEHLPVDDRLLSVALLAAVLLLDDLTLAVAVGAGGLEALDHGAHLAHHGLHTVAVASGAAADGALLAAAALALGADDGPLQSQLGDLAPVDILQGDLVRVVDRPGLGRAAVLHAAEHASQSAAEAAAAAKELGEEILRGHAATSTAALQAGLSILVVDLALVGVG